MKTHRDYPPAHTALATTGRSLALKLLRSAAVALPLLGACLLQAAETPTAAPGKTRAAAQTESKDSPPAAVALAPAAAVALDPVVVVGSRSPELLSTVSPSITYIGADQLGLAGNYTLADALRDQAGVFVLGDAIGNTASIFTRGAESRMTTFTLDGRRLNPGFSNFDTSYLTTDNLSSVQIQRGASSTFHGANAAAGVIDLRTADPFALSKPAGSISGEAGSYGYRRGAVEYAAASEVSPALGKLGVSLGGSWTESDGKRPNSDYRAANFLPRIDWRLNDQVTFNLLARYYDYVGGNPGGTAYPSLTDRLSVTNTLVSPGVKIKVNEDVELHAYYSYTRNVYDALDTAYPDKNIAEGHEGTVQASWRINDIVAVAGGYTYESKIYDRKTQGYHDYVDSNSPWLNVRLTPVKDLLVSIAGRYNHFTHYDSAWTGEGNISYRLAATGTTFHARVANAYNVPDIGTISYDYSYGYGPVANIRADGLKPEKNLSWEVGLKQQFNVLKGANIGAVLFQNHFSDLIQWDYGAHVGYNINKARTQGIELNADIRLNDQFRLYGNATFLNTEDRTTGARLLRRPDFSGTLGIEHTPTDRITVGLSVTYVHGVEDTNYPSRVDLKPYYYGRLYANFRVWENVEVFGRVENLFNQNYSQVYGYPALPVTAYAGVRFRF